MDIVPAQFRNRLRRALLPEHKIIPPFIHLRSSSLVFS